MEATAAKTQRESAPDPPMLGRIAAGIDGLPEGEDAAALSAALAKVTGAHVTFIAVHSDPLITPPVGVSWTSLRKEAQAMLYRTRAAHVPKARTVIETDFSVPRALHRVIRRARTDLLVMGSSRQGPEGRVRIGKRTRQLLCHFECPLAVAPRGFRERQKAGFSRIGVGYEGGAESQAALELAASIAVAAGAKLEVNSVVDDRIPLLGWSRFAHGRAEQSRWEDLVLGEVERRRIDTEAAATATGATGKVEIKRGRPATALLDLSENVDLLVIGSRRWGPVSRLLLGSTGEAVLHDAACPVLVVPRPAG
jgi:nucleotide-binding universal stress UspA family protein